MFHRSTSLLLLSQQGSWSPARLKETASFSWKFSPGCTIHVQISPVPVGSSLFSADASTASTGSAFHSACESSEMSFSQNSWISALSCEAEPPDRCVVAYVTVSVACSCATNWDLVLSSWWNCKNTNFSSLFSQVWCFCRIWTAVGWNTCRGTFYWAHRCQLLCNLKLLYYCT